MSTWSEPGLNGIYPQVDMHSVHFHGQILTIQNHHTDTASLFPGSSATAQMVADNVGHWLLTCTVNDHLMGERASFIFSIRPIISQRSFSQIQAKHSFSPDNYFMFEVLCLFDGFVQLGCRLYLRSRSVSQTFINRDHMGRLDSTSLLLRKKSGIMLLRHLVMGWLLYRHMHTFSQNWPVLMFLKEICCVNYMYLCIFLCV